MPIVLAQVREVARRLDLTDPDGNLKELDSLKVLDLAMELESAFSVKIPSTAIRVKTLENLDSICRLLNTLSA